MKKRTRNYILELLETRHRELQALLSDLEGLVEDGERLLQEFGQDLPPKLHAKTWARVVGANAEVIAYREELHRNEKAQEALS